MRVAIIGCGGIGRKRFLSLKKHELVLAADLNLPSAISLCELAGTGIATDNWRDILNQNIDIAVIATSNSDLAEIGAEVLKRNINVIIEKPAGRNLSELNMLKEAEENSLAKAKVGFNHRYHPALIKARQIVESGALGELMFIRGRYGHGGRIGYEREWRADPRISGGGELIDQGVHLIDLARWFLGDFEKVDGFAPTYYWNMTVDDNGFMALRTASNKMAWLHVSCTEWKNTFSFEIYGHDGKLQIDGLGGSYGTERLTYYKMLPEMGPPETTIWEFPFPDQSWDFEIQDFIQSIEKDQVPNGNLDDAVKAMEVVEKIYGGRYQ